MALTDFETRPSPDVLGQTRFSFSPLTEATLSLRLLGQPRPPHVHAPWLREARGRFDGVDLEHFAVRHAAGAVHRLLPGTPGTCPRLSPEDQLSLCRY
jgi:hypothetical protein